MNSDLSALLLLILRNLGAWGEMSRLENKDMETHDYVQWFLKGVLLFVHESGQLLGLLWNKDAFTGKLYPQVRV